MSTEFGLVYLWIAGYGVTRFVALLLLAMSLASWTVIVLKTLNVLAARKQAGRVEAFWHTADISQGLKALGSEANNPFHALVQSGQQALGYVKNGSVKGELSHQIDTSDWLTRGLQNAIDDATAQLQSGRLRRSLVCSARFGAFTMH